MMDHFSLVYADPPWAESGGGKIKRGADRHYPLMASRDIAALPVAQVVADDALLMLWATSNYLPDALAVATAWGFRYVTHRVWVKPSLGLGQWLRLRHELLLLCRRGKCPVPVPTLRADSVLTADRGRHSAKPPEARAWAEGIAPAGDRLELFGREPVAGWTVLGNEVGGDIRTDLCRLAGHLAPPLLQELRPVQASMFPAAGAPDHEDVTP